MDATNNEGMATNRQESENPESTWQQDTDADTDAWRRRIRSSTYCRIIQYAGTDNYYWATTRNDFRLSGITKGRDSAMADADRHMDMPIESFNSMVAAEMIDKLREIEKDLLRLQPDINLLPGYHAGYEAGAEETRQRVAAVLNLS